MFIELLTKNSWKQIGSIPVVHLGNWDAAASKRELPKKVFSKQDLFLVSGLMMCLESQSRLEGISPGRISLSPCCFDWSAWPPSLESRSRLETLWWLHWWGISPGSTVTLRRSQAPLCSLILDSRAFSRGEPHTYTTVEMCALSEECENISVMCVFVGKLTSVTKWRCSVLRSAQRPSESDDRHSSQKL